MESHYPFGATLASQMSHGVHIEVCARLGVLHLQFIDYRDRTPMRPWGDPTRPIGLRRFQESHFPAPVFALSGNFVEDSAIAEDWLRVHHAWVRDAERIYLEEQR